MKKLCLLLTAAVGALLMTGCASTSPEYFEELDEKEQKQLLNSAKVLALQGNAVPEHLKGIFMDLAPHQRIVYDGDKRGKASFRWEIYDRPERRGKITQKDINPYWVMVYAIGDLTDPQWKLSHAHEDESLQTTAQPPRRVTPEQQQRRQRRAPVRQYQQVRYKN